MLDINVLKGFDFEGAKKETIENFVVKESKNGFEFSSSAIHELDKAVIRTYEVANKKIKILENKFDEQVNKITEIFFLISFDREPVDKEITSLNLTIFVEDVTLEFETGLMNARVETAVVYEKSVE